MSTATLNTEAKNEENKTNKIDNLNDIKEQHDTNSIPEREVHRGDIWFVNAGSTGATGRENWSNRPALIVSNNGINKSDTFVTVVYLRKSTKIRSSSHVNLGNILNNEDNTIAMCEQIHTVDLSRLSHYMGSISSDKKTEINEALLNTLGLIHYAKTTDNNENQN